MEDSYEPCRSCGEVIPAIAKSCPECAYDLARHNRRRFYLGALGTLLTLTIVLAPIGVPLLLSAARHRSLAEGTVTRHEPRSLADHIRAVIRHQLSLTPTFGSTGEFTRGGSDAASVADHPPRL